jgi:hypothetical protein
MDDRFKVQIKEADLIECLNVGDYPDWLESALETAQDKLERSNEQIQIVITVDK